MTGRRRLGAALAASTFLALAGCSSSGPSHPALPTLGSNPGASISPPSVSRPAITAPTVSPTTPQATPTTGTPSTTPAAPTTKAAPTTTAVTAAPTTVAPTTTIATTTSLAPVTTAPASGGIAAPTSGPATTPVTTVASATSAPTAPGTTTSSGGVSPWLWVALGLLLLAAIAAALLVRSRKRAAARAAIVRRAVDEAHQLADTASMPPVNADPATVAAWWELIASRDAALTRTLASFEPGPPEDQLSAAIAGVDIARRNLMAAVEEDRSLRRAAAIPTGEQLEYSMATLRERANGLRRAADVLSAVSGQSSTA